MNPGYPLTLEKLKEWHYSIINVYREEKINSGFVFNGIVFDSDERARQNINGACTLGLILMEQGKDFPSTFVWRSKDNQNIPINAAGIINMSLTLGNFITTCYKISWHHKAQVSAIDNVPELLAYDISTGWPA